MIKFNIDFIRAIEEYVKMYFNNFFFYCIFSVLINRYTFN